MNTQLLSTTGTGTDYGFTNEDEISSNMFSKYEQTFDKLKTKIGSEVSGEIISITNREVLVDFGGKAPATVNLDSNEKSCLADVSVGNTIKLVLSDIKEKKKEVIYTGSFYAAKQLEIAKLLEESIKNKSILTGIVKSMSHAGYDVYNETFGMLFMPHLLADVNKLPEPEVLINTEINFLIEFYNKDNVNSYVASRKAYLDSFAQIEISTLEKGKVYSGFATGTTPFAVFVQFNNCLTAMIHKSNLTPAAKEALEAGTIEAGTPFEFYIKDYFNNKIFGTQILRDSLWDSIKVKQQMQGKVSSIKEFGILVELDYETKGLIHFSNLDKNFITKYKIGDTLNVVVTAVNKNNRQITLALK